MSKLPRILPLIAIALGGVFAVRAADVAPELFQNARAWAEEAAPAAGDVARPAAAVAPSAVCALNEEQLAQQAGISPAELRIIQSLSTRRGELDARDQDFATMLPLMAAAEQRLDERLAALNAIKAEVEALLGQADEREQAEVTRLVEVYQAMRPRDAAAVFATLDDAVRLPVAQNMRPRALSAIMAQMPPAAARELTEKLARRYESQQLAARSAVAAGDSARPATDRVADASPAEAAPEAPSRPAPRRRPAPEPAPEAAPRPEASAAEAPARPRQTVQ